MDLFLDDPGSPVREDAVQQHLCLGAETPAADEDIDRDQNAEEHVLQHRKRLLHIRCRAAQDLLSEFRKAVLRPVLQFGLPLRAVLLPKILQLRMIFHKLIDPVSALLDLTGQRLAELFDAVHELRQHQHEQQRNDEDRQEHRQRDGQCAGKFLPILSEHLQQPCFDAVAERRKDIGDNGAVEERLKDACDLIHASSQRFVAEDEEKQDEPCRNGGKSG